MTMDFQVFHKYRALVRRGQAPPIKCLLCHANVMFSIDSEGDPVLECYYCGARTRVGLNTYHKIEEAVYRSEMGQET